MAKRTTKKYYEPKLKVQDYILDTKEGRLGQVQMINNHCNVRDNNNPVEEYYVKWPGGAWSRYDSQEFDRGDFTGSPYYLMPATPAAMALFGPKTKKKPPAQSGRRTQKRQGR